MMSKDKYPSIFSPQMEAVVFIILQIVLATRGVLKIGDAHANSSIRSRDVLRAIAHERKDYKRGYMILLESQNSDP